MIYVILLIITGFSAGVLVAGGAFALLTKVGVITRMIAALGTENKISLYQIMIILGGVWGNIVSIFDLPMPGSRTLLVLVGLLSGVFAGALSIALAEAINVLPVIFRKLDLRKGIPWVVFAFALGKMTGSLLWFLT